MISAESARARLLTLGFPEPALIGSGMEGHVFRVSDDSIAKVWDDKPHNGLILLQQFYDVVQSLNLPFATPRITTIESIDGNAITIERALAGTTLQTFIDSNDAVVAPMALDAVISVLQALNDINLPDSGRVPPIPVLGMPPELSLDRQPTNMRLLAVASQNLSHSEIFLHRAISDFDDVKHRIFLLVSRLPTVELRLVHGDIFPPNMLLDSTGKVSALLDWGFLSFSGDPAFDASLAAGFYDMYGPYHRQLDDELLEACVNRLGHSRDRLLLYRGLYALLTSTAYAADASDGQFDWCVEQLNREDVRKVLSQRSVI